VTACPACGADNSGEARFCSSCGSPLPAPERLLEARKVVTVVFCDVSGSTSLGEQLDPEALRRVMSRYFDVMQAAVERHGGVVEKFIGDAVMAVFGIPKLHEDDALRAVRAAVDMRESLTSVNDEFGVRLQTRIGLNTGEVVAGDPSTGQRLVTGDAVNVAARLEQGATPGQILLGVPTYRLVRHVVDAQPVDPLEVKGKTEAVGAYLLASVEAGFPRVIRRLDTPFAGRGKELELLRLELDRTIEEHACRLVTILGPAGIGKSRLVEELLRVSGEASRALVGRCLPYGDGITYWPLVEIMRQLGGTDVRSATRHLVQGEEYADLIAERVAAATGQAESAGATEETFWAVRKLFEALARRQPVIVVLDDLHWAEPTFLDLVEYLVAFSSGASMLFVCTARPELLDVRATWTAPRPNARSLLLGPLAEDDAESLIDHLVESSKLSGTTRREVLAKSEGNPLFVEQMVALRAERGDGELEAPPTIQALLAARIDLLEEDERTVIALASVEGRLFHRGAIVELAPKRVRPAVSKHLLALVRKELIHPDRAEFPGEDAFRFSHILIRDAAYGALPKELRAELHERFSGWLVRMTEGYAHEYEEIVGYHLERAHRYRGEIGQRAAAASVGASAGKVLASSGLRALARSDMPAARGLLERAVSLLPEEDPLRDDCRLALGDTLHEVGEFERGLEVLEGLTGDAERLGDVRMHWRARLRAAWPRLLTRELPTAEAARLAHEGIAALTPLGDDEGLALAWEVAAQERNLVGDNAGLEAAMRNANLHARRAGNVRLVTHSAFWLGLCSFYGNDSVSEAGAACELLLAQAETPIQRANARLWLGAVVALGGDLEGLIAVRDARATYLEFGLRQVHSGTAIAESDLELLAGDPSTAEHTARDAISALAEMGEKTYRSTLLLHLAHALIEQERHEEAEHALRQTEALIAPGEDLHASLILALQGVLALERGSPTEAERLARETLVHAESSGTPHWTARSRVIVATVLEGVGLADEAREAAQGALHLYRRKGAVLGVRQVEQVLAGLARA
jgi:class 3 adenylate cyclase/tetratricopeptide (TPR) repeat protein